jgi:hypothetical protein
MARLAAVFANYLAALGGRKASLRLTEEDFLFAFEGTAREVPSWPRHSV